MFKNFLGWLKTRRTKIRNAVIFTIIVIAVVIFLYGWNWTYGLIMTIVFVIGHIILAVVDYLNEMIEYRNNLNDSQRIKNKKLYYIIIKYAVSAAMLIVPLHLINNQSEPPTNPSYEMSEILMGVWSGTYITETQGITNLDLTITNYENNIISAYFHFSPHPNNPDIPNGIFSMFGTISDDMLISLVAEEWVGPRPAGYYVIDLRNAVLSIDSMTITSDDEFNLHLHKRSNDPTFERDSVIVTTEGFLASLTPWRKVGVNGFIVNNDYNTVYGSIPIGFVATSANRRYDQVISVSGDASFDLIYKIEGEFTTIRGRVGFDDRTILSDEVGQLMNLENIFRGEATVSFLSNDVLLIDPMKISRNDNPQEFIIEDQEIGILTIRFEFPHNPAIPALQILNLYHGHFKYFNLIEVSIK